MDRSILVVEDSPTQAEHLRLLLEGEGYRVELARSGREGLDRVRHNRPDLIISDVIMPEMDGYAFLEAVKSNEDTKRIPVVLLTQRKTALDILMGMERGADNFIPKPFEDGYLLERVQRIFEHLELRRRGRLEVDITLRMGKREIQITADKQQIIELCFSTFEEVCRLNRHLEESQRVVDEYARVQEAYRLKDEFLANMSHELRTPLNAIIGFAQLMHDGKVGPVAGRHREFLGDILTSARHLLQLITDVLDLSRVESGKMEFHPERVDLARLAGEVRDALRNLAGSKRIDVAIDVAAGIGDVSADPRKLKQLLFNYLSNALKFTPDEGRVTVRALREGADAFRLEVEDTGIGIRPEDVGRLFTEFQQLDAGTAKKYPGTGLGLALTKRLVEAQGGRVGVRSVPGRGSLFFAVLPRTIPAGRRT